MPRALPSPLQLTEAQQDQLDHLGQSVHRQPGWGTPAQAHRYILGVVGLEVAIMALVEVDHNGHHFADRQLALA
jgi:hypothetical protein